MKKVIMGLINLMVLVRCGEKETVAPITRPAEAATMAITATTATSRMGNAYYVTVTGDDATADGTSLKPAKTLQYAITKVGVGNTVVLGAGTFVENGLIEVPLGISVEGAGSGLTILKAVNSFYYHPASPSYATDKFLISLNAGSMSSGNQSLQGFTIDGDSKQLHGGIYVKNRSNLTINDVKVQNTNFTGIWLWDVKASKITNSKLLNCSWGSASYCSGALNLGNVEQVEISQLDVNESTGYGIKAIGPSGNNNIIGLKIHDSRVSVNPYGLWNNGTAPNIAIELWSVNLVGSEIYNTYVDNTISLVNSNATPSTGIQTMRLHHNTLDMDTRSHGRGYGLELTIHDAEVDHNYFLKGNYGIANWDHAMTNWSIHHNTFYAMGGTYPGEVVRSQNNGLHNVKLYNNTIEFSGTQTMNVVGAYGGSSDNVDVCNNLFINSNTSYSYYPNQLVHLENGASLTNLQVKNNNFKNLPVGNVSGSYSNNTTTDPKILQSGNRADPYYTPQSGSTLIDGGINVGFPFTGSAPDIGAFEYGGTITASVVPPTGVNLSLESSTAGLTGKMIIGSDATAGVNYFYVPAGSGKNYSIPPPASASFSFQLTKTDSYVIWAKIKSPTSNNQSSYIYNGSGKWFTWAAGVHTAWTWVKITDGTVDALFPFTQGTSSFKIGWIDDSVQINQVYITNNRSYIPS